MSEALLRLDDVHQTYKVRGQRGSSMTTSEVRAVNGITLDIAAGRTIGLVGESGCGKSTLARMMVGLEHPSSGSVTWQGQPVEKMSRSQRRAFHRQIQLVFQDPHAALDPRRTILDSVAEGIVAHKLVPASKIPARVGELLTQVGLAPDFMHRHPHEFSGGQLQRVGIARALAVDPKVIVCDEPVSALDISVRAQVLNLLNRLKSELDLAIVFIAHDLEIVQHMSDEIVTMYLGKIVEHGATDGVYETPAHPYTKALLSAIPRRRGEGEQRVVLQGDPPSPIDVPKGCSFHGRCYAARDICATTVPGLEPIRIDPEHRSACLFADDVVGSTDHSSPITLPQETS